MAWTVVYGLTFATFLTLIVVPVMYLLFYKFELFFKKLFGTARPLDAGESGDALEQSLTL
jgi:hypothetical protein